ncbi:MAG: hypothetical protein E7410_04020 [Ruminococcaceae bacterium]|nr:hypothetical protein [Oscillospiraceae bacterium]
MNKKTVVIISLVLAFAMLFTVISSVALSGIYSLSAAASDLNDKLNQNKQKQNELQSELAQTTKEKKQMQAQKEALDDDMAELATKIDSINRAIAKNNSDISEKQAEITNLEKNIEDSDELLKKRLRVMYEKGSSSYLEVLFSATSFSDLLIRMDMVQQLYAHDQKLIEELTNTKKGVEEAKATIESAKAANVELKSELAAKKSEIQKKSDESQSIINKLSKTEAELKAEIAQKQAESQSILNAIAAAKGQHNVTNTYTGGTLAWPSTLSGTITSRFGPRTLRGIPDNHTGLDIGVPMGTPVLACEAGVVTGSGWRNAYGYCITIDHGSITTLYAHNSVLQVKVGERVSRGQQIALAGSTGNSTGPHIHLGVIKNGKYVDPAPYVGL